MVTLDDKDKEKKAVAGADAPAAASPKWATNGPVERKPAGGKRKGLDGPSNYEGVYDLLRREIAENPLETSQQRRLREKREKWDGIVSGLGDAASAVANLVFTTKGAPNMYDPRNSLSEKARARRERAKAERDANRDKHLHYAMQEAQMRDADRNWRFQLEQTRLAAAERAAERERQRNMDEEEKRRYAEEKQHRAKREKVADDQWQKSFDRAGKDADRNYRMQRAQLARASAGGSGNSGDGRISLNVGGNVTYYNNKTDYERAVMREAKRLGIPMYTKVVKESNNVPGGNNSLDTYAYERKPIEQLAGEVEHYSGDKVTGLGLGPAGK